MTRIFFDPFFTTKLTGTGLGLSLSYDLATQLGGYLEASNLEQGGAVFELWLPKILPEDSVPSLAESNPLEADALV
jgi:C4-dicarboxylate-specific signal transduction histidine kinase